MAYIGAGAAIGLIAPSAVVIAGTAAVALWAADRYFPGSVLDTAASAITEAISEAFAGFSPLVSRNLIVEEVGDYIKMMDL